MQPSVAMSNPGHSRLMTVQQLAEATGMSQREIRTLIRDHGLPCYRLHETKRRGPRGTKIRLNEFEAWLASRKRR